MSAFHGDGVLRDPDEWAAERGLSFPAWASRTAREDAMVHHELIEEMQRQLAAQASARWAKLLVSGTTP